MFEQDFIHAILPHISFYNMIQHNTIHSNNSIFLFIFLLGNERFTEHWMGAYEYEILQSREKFAREIDVTVRKLSTKLPSSFSSDLKDFILKFLIMKPTERPTVAVMCNHPWVSDSVIKMRAQLK